MTEKPSSPTRSAITDAITATGSVSAAADALGVTQPILRRIMRELEIPTPRARGWPRVTRPSGSAPPQARPRASRAGQDSKPGAEVPAPPMPRVDRDSAFADAAASLACTGGRYRELTAFAERHGLTYTQALQRWHQLRLPVAKRGRA